jgi:hypothetical protein
MPQGDGTGPFGEGPGTGRGRGRGRRRFYEGNFFMRTPGRRRFSFFAAAAPVVGALIKDITNPNGFFRTLAKKLIINKKSPVKETGKNKIDADFTVLDEKDYNNPPQKSK